MFGVEDAGRWSLLNTFQQVTEVENSSRHWQVLDETQLERLISIYLQRWGVLFRGIVDKEPLAPPWRILLSALRKLELRGTLRGGRFISGAGGEQFAYPETVDALRKFKRSRESASHTSYFCLAANDPLNLLNLILPGRKLPRVSNNRVLYRGGIPVAVLESGEIHFLKKTDADQQWQQQQMLTRKVFPARLKSYLGNK